jgi:hypothetical protein
MHKLQLTSSEKTPVAIVSSAATHGHRISITTINGAYRFPNQGLKLETVNALRHLSMSVKQRLEWIKNSDAVVMHKLQLISRTKTSNMSAGFVEIAGLMTFVVIISGVCKFINH